MPSIAGHVVNRGDMIGVEGVTQTEAIGQDRGAKQNGAIVERSNGWLGSEGRKLRRCVFARSPTYR
jgi:hypothetical protein